ncbi:hypothetical protein HK099_008264 [Clydaea vesicula]|uniref:Uncharacterized protein n=1 Tax=Clydaea vesicula TaxID=447962 RepID=A0AAD5XVX2_9FUNG|nr:hypothetical protein HK099_008264 [Clydaea vesicula]
MRLKAEGIKNSVVVVGHKHPDPKHHTWQEVEDDTIDKHPVVRGTGGTDLVPFLKQMRDETLLAKCEVKKNYFLK